MKRAALRICAWTMCVLAIFAAGRSVHSQDWPPGPSALGLGLRACEPTSTRSRPTGLDISSGGRSSRSPTGRSRSAARSDGRLLAVFPTKGDWSRARRVEGSGPCRACWPNGAAVEARRSPGAASPSCSSRWSVRAAQPHARRLPAAERTSLRTLPRGVGRDL